MTAQPDWTLQDFVSEPDAWVEAEHPTDELRVLVTNWIFTRISDPFVNARRVADRCGKQPTVFAQSRHALPGTVLLLPARRTAEAQPV